MLSWKSKQSEAFARIQQQIAEHAMDDKRQFDALAASIDIHEANTATRHAQNQSFQTEIRSSQAALTAKLDRVESAVGTIDTLLPAIRQGIEVDQRAIYRRKLAKRVIGTILATLVTVSALIPLFQVLFGLRIAVHTV